MNKNFAVRWLSAGVCLLVACGFVFLALGENNPAGNSWTTPLADTNSSHLAIVPWGAPDFTVGDFNTFPSPAWLAAAARDGGVWLTNEAWFGWQPTLGPWESGLSSNRLLVQLDRSLVSSNLWLAVAAAGENDARLLAGFYDQTLAAVANPVILHVSDTAPWYTNQVNLAAYPSASIVSFFVTNGVMRVFCSVLARVDSSASETTAPAIATHDHPAVTGLADGAPSSTPSFKSDAAPSAAVKGSAVASAAGSLANARIWYVNAGTGDDTCDGQASVRQSTGSVGPKRTILAALSGAVSGDTIIVAPGKYPGRVNLNGVKLITNGRVEM